MTEETVICLQKHLFLRAVIEIELLPCNLTPQSAVQENNQIETFVPKSSACINIKTRSWFGSKIYCEKKRITLISSYEMALYVKVEARDYQTKSPAACFL